MNAPVSKILTVGLAGGLGLAALGIGASAAGAGRTEGPTRIVAAAPAFAHHDVATPAPGTGIGPYGMTQGPATGNGSYEMTPGPATGHGPENYAGMQAAHGSPAMPHANNRPVAAPASGPLQSGTHAQDRHHVTPPAGAGGMGGPMGGRR